MINWLYFPHTASLDDTSMRIVNIFKKHADAIDSTNHTHSSNTVLSMLSADLIDFGFQVETGKTSDAKVRVPVLYGLNGMTQLAFEADAYYSPANYVVEIEAGRAVTNYQFLKDFFEACAMQNADYLCIAVRNIYYHGSKDFEKVCQFFEALYASNRLQIPLKGLLIVGY